MLERQSLWLSSETRLASRDRRGAAFARQTPRQNHLLAALPAQEYARLLPDLVPLPLPRDWTIHGGGDREQDLYFLTSGIVSRACVMNDGMSTKFAVTGNEGAIGVALFLGGGGTSSEAVVLSPGYAYRLGANLVRSEFEHYGALPRMLLRYTQALITQTGQSAACNRHHSLVQRLCRWILSCLDRLPSNELAITQEVIAGLLGARRESVTEAAAGLQRAGVIRCRRGRIAVLDRPQLEARACECYTVVKREYARLLPANRQPKSLVHSGLPCAGGIFTAPAKLRVELR
jgi:CRP-like cAMP-binding protein